MLGGLDPTDSFEAAVLCNNLVNFRSSLIPPLPSDFLSYQIVQVVSPCSSCWGFRRRLSSLSDQILQVWRVLPKVFCVSGRLVGQWVGRLVGERMGAWVGGLSGVTRFLLLQCCCYRILYLFAHLSRVVGCIDVLDS